VVASGGAAHSAPFTLADTGCLFPRSEQLDHALLRSARHVHVAPFELAAATEAVASARRAGATTSADLEPGSIRGGLDPLTPLLAELDVCFVNHHAAQELSPSGDPLDAIAALHGRGPRCVVLTAGADGATVSVDGEVTAVPGVSADVVDTTGAGDAFCAAFLAERALGHDEISAARAAVMAGALACAAIGAQTGAPTRAALTAALGAADASSGPTP
jgi:sugar/nucleoside kinase (ribokinase family)